MAMTKAERRRMEELATKTVELGERIVHMNEARSRLEQRTSDLQRTLESERQSHQQRVADLDRQNNEAIQHLQDQNRELERALDQTRAVLDSRLRVLNALNLVISQAAATDPDIAR